MDTSFNPGTGANNSIYAVAIQSDGKILIGGSFSSYNGTIINRIARLNSDGSLDTSFNPGIGASSTIYSLAIQSDGKILIGGIFSLYNGTTRNHIARLNSDGSLDTSFNPGTGSNSDIKSLAIQSDGKILIGGYFTSYNGTTRNYIARLNSDGLLDTSFDPGTGASSFIYSFFIQSDGKIITGGNFTLYNGTTRNHIARLNSDGSLDTSFDPGTGANYAVNSIIVQSDKVLIGGAFTSYNGTTRNHIARLNSDGLLDTSFDPGTGASGTINSLIIQSDSKLIIGGSFGSYSGASINCIARLDSDGTLDTSFNVNSTGINSYINSAVIQSDGKILIGGAFTSHNGISRNRIARLNSDGLLDTSFDPGTGASGTINSLIIQSDGKILIGGSFSNYNGIFRNSIARLNSDGSLDTSFNLGTGPNNYTQSIAIQSDGKIVIGGGFTTYNGTTRNYIVRLNSDRSLDTSFDPGAGANNSVTSVAIQSDSKILIGGGFTTYNGTTINRIARLNSDGSLDTSFNVGTGASSTVQSITIQSDGKVLIGGSFTSYNGTTINRIARLNSDGSLDTSFNTGTGTNASIYSINIQSDGKILIGGGFSSYNGTARNNIARINSDGSLDNDFNPGAGANNYVASIALQSDGKVIAAGGFNSYNDIPVAYIARINNPPVTTPTVTTNAVSSISYTIATGNGNLTSTGDGSTTRYIQWGISSGTYTSSCNAGATTSTGNYSCSMTSLTAGTTYYVRAYATNSSGTGYGDEISFSTTAIAVPTVTTNTVTSINYTTATGGGNVTATNGANPTIRGVEWGTATGSYTNSCNAGAGGIGAYTCSMTSLTSGTTYYVRAFATNSAGTGYGTEISFNTLSGSPTVTTNSTTSITSIGATGNGNITNTGGNNPERFIQWGTTSGIYTSECTAGTGGTGTYSCAMNSLTPETTYYYRAKATNSGGTSYGDESSFTTIPEGIIIPDPIPQDMTDAYNEGYISIGTGTLNSTNQVTTNLDLTITSNNGQATLPVNTQITNTDSGNIDMSQFSISNVTTQTKSTISTTRGSIEIGIPNTNLTFSQPIEISISVGTQYNGDILTIQSRSYNQSDWTDEGTCTVTNGICSFTTTHATTYTVNGDGTITGETNINTNLPIESTISLSCPDSLDLTSITGTGQSTIDTSNEATCNIATNNSNGYKLEWQASSNNMQNSNSDTISSYTPITPNAPEPWLIDNTASEWGARLKSTSTDNDTSTWGLSDGYDGNWLNIDNSTPFEIIRRTEETDQSGSDEIIQFGAEVGSNKFQPSGTYTTTVTMTATTL